MSTTVREVMTAPVITVEETTPFQTIAELLTTHQIAALPVTDAAGRLVGLVSETDLMLKGGHPHAANRHPLLEGFRRRAVRIKAAGRTAGAIMTTPPLTVVQHTPIPEAARLMQDRKVHHLPVIDVDGELVGIVSRSDLLRVYVRTDDTIRRDITEQVIARQYPPDSERITAEVERGVVTLEGRIERTSSIKPLVHAVQEIAGVVGVDEDLIADVDDINVHASYYPLLRS